MELKTDDFGPERPRSRRLMSVIAMLAPIVLLAGASAWFIRAYVMPPMITIPEPPAISSADATPAGPAPAPVAPASETIGASPAASPAPPGPNNWPASTLPARAASVWDSVPLPGPPRQMHSLAAAPVVAASEPITVPIPLPPARPRVSATDFDLSAVPLPRPRPPASN